MSETIAMVLTRVGLALMGLADIVMLSRHGQGALAAAALVEGSYGRGLDAAIAFVASALPIMARATGGRDIGLVVRLWRRQALAAGLLGTLLLLAAPWAGTLFAAAGQPALLAEAAAPLAPIMAIGALFGLIAIACAIALEATGQAGRVTRAVLLGNLANVAFNAWFIGGGAGLPPLGAAGSMLSTALVRFCLMLWLGLALRRHARASRGHDGSGRDPGVSRQAIAGTIALGMTLGFHVFGLAMTIFAGWLGVAALAAYTASLALNLPAMIVVSGLGDAVALRVGRDPTHRVIASVAPLSAGVAALAAALAMLAPAIAALYTTDPALRAALTHLLPFAALLLWLDATSALLFSVLRGRQFFGLPASIQLVSMAIALSLAWWLVWSPQGPALGVAGLLDAILAGSLLRLPAMGLALVATSRDGSAAALIGRAERELT